MPIETSWIQFSTANGQKVKNVPSYAPRDEYQNLKRQWHPRQRFQPGLSAENRRKAHHATSSATTAKAPQHRNEDANSEAAKSMPFHSAAQMA